MLAYLELWDESINNDTSLSLMIMNEFPSLSILKSLITFCFCFIGYHIWVCLFLYFFERFVFNSFYKKNKHWIKFLFPGFCRKFLQFCLGINGKCCRRDNYARYSSSLSDIDSEFVEECCRSKRRKSCRYFSQFFKRSDEKCSLCSFFSVWCCNDSTAASSSNQHCTWAAFYKLHLPPPLPTIKISRNQRDPLNSERNGMNFIHTEIISEGFDSIKCEVQMDEYTNSDESTGSESHSAINVGEAFTYRPSFKVALIDLTRMQQWSVILDMYRQNRLSKRDAKYHDFHGLLPIHWACSGSPPIDVVNLLIELYPHGVRKVDDEGSTPLHYATHYRASRDVVYALLKAHPPSVRRLDKYGRSPLYHAVDKNVSLQVLRTLAQVDPKMITYCLSLPTTSIKYSKTIASSKSGAVSMTTIEPVESSLGILRAKCTLSPLHLIWSLFEKKFRVKPFLTKCDPSIVEHWDKACLLLEIAWNTQLLLDQGRVSKNELIFSTQWDNYEGGNYGSTILHAAIAFDLFLPDFVIPLLVSTQPELLRRRDYASGLLPLSLMSKLKSYSPSRSSYLMRILLEAYPEASYCRDIHGRSALSLALSSGCKKYEDVERLIHAAPESLEWRDRLTGLPPVLVKACAPELNEAKAISPTCSALSVNYSSCENDTEKLEIIYELVRANPMVLFSPYNVGARDLALDKNEA